MIVVSDTSPISNLILIGRLELLRHLFSEVVVPVAVDREVRALEKFGIDILPYDTADWIRVADPQDLRLVSSLMLSLDEGEAQAISLAIELDCELLLMDERIGTRIAREEGLTTIGLVGVLVRAKREGLIHEVGPILRELKSEAGFWIGNELEARVLRDVGEVEY